mmetsp:Transcript_25748/g.80625  ORF Transcript_25748/g.80625 Transcript_25748/m.80625 type:complete len:245 (+) Transcript_25748:141-875(+)
MSSTDSGGGWLMLRRRARSCSARCAFFSRVRFSLKASSCCFFAVSSICSFIISPSFARRSLAWCHSARSTFSAARTRSACGPSMPAAPAEPAGQHGHHVGMFRSLWVTASSAACSRSRSRRSCLLTCIMYSPSTSTRMSSLRGVTGRSRSGTARQKGFCWKGQSGPYHSRSSSQRCRNCVQCTTVRSRLRPFQKKGTMGGGGGVFAVRGAPFSGSSGSAAAGASWPSPSGGATTVGGACARRES